MKKLVIVLCILSYVVPCSGKCLGYLKVEVFQCGQAYTLQPIKNDGILWGLFNQENIRLVHEADSSYVEQISEVHIDFLMDETLAYYGKEPGMFGKTMATAIKERLIVGKKYDFQLGLKFVVTSNGIERHVEIDTLYSDKKMTPVDEFIIQFTKDALRGWKPEYYDGVPFNTPLEVKITAKNYFKGLGLIITDFDRSAFRRRVDELWTDSRAYAQHEKIPECQIVPDDDLDTKAHMADSTMSIDRWIKENVQDAVEIVGFPDCRSTIELIISANGWVAESKIISTDDQILGKHLAKVLLDCPRMVPATANGENVPSRMIVDYYWHF